MAILRTGYPDLYLSRLALMVKVIHDSMEAHPSIYPQLFNMEMMKGPFVQTTGLSGFAQVPEISEGEDVTYQDILQGYDKKYTALKYRSGYKISREALDDDQDAAFAKAARQMGFSGADSIETIAMNTFNNGFSSSFTGPDGKELFATDHPLTGGGTEQNELTNAADLSVTSLRQALVDFMDTTTNQGIKQYIKPKILLVPYELNFQGAELLQSVQDPESANGAINPLKNQGLTLTSSEFLTDSDAWFLLAAPVDHYLYFWWRDKPETKDDWEFDAELMKVALRFRMVVGWSDFRGVFGSPGA